MIGIDTRSWYASEYLKDGVNEYFAFANYNRVEMYKIYWTGPETFLLYEPGDFHIRSLSWDRGSVTQGQPATLTVVATGWNGRQVTLLAGEPQPGGGEQSVPPENLGLPSQLELTADTTRFVWTAQIHHDSGDTTSPMTIVIRDGDSTAQAPPIRVVPPPPPFQLHTIAWSAAGAQVGTPVTLELDATGASGQTVTLEAVERLPGGGETSLDITALGLPSSLSLATDTTRRTWSARIRRASNDTTTAMALVIRSTADGVESAPLVVSQPSGPPAFAITRLSWNQDSLYAHLPVTLCIVATNWSGESAALSAIEELPGGGQASLSMASLGLPDSIPLQADTTRLVWCGRIRHASGDTTGALDLVVRSAAFGVQSPVLRLLQPPPPPAPDQDPGGTPEDRRLRFRMTASSVFGARPTFLVDLPGPGAVRLDLFDLQGRRVRSLTDRELPKGATLIPWDGRDAGGQAVGRGLYFARLVTRSETRVVKLVVARPITP